MGESRLRYPSCARVKVWAAFSRRQWNLACVKDEKERVRVSDTRRFSPATMGIAVAAVSGGGTTTITNGLAEGLYWCRVCWYLTTMISRRPPTFWRGWTKD